MEEMNISSYNNQSFYPYLPHLNIIRSSLRQKLITVLSWRNVEAKRYVNLYFWPDLGVWDHADDDGEEGAGEGPQEELLAAGQARVLYRVQAEEGHWDGEEPEPLPEQGGGDKQLLNLQHEHVESVQHLGSQLEDHHKQQEVVRENRPLQTGLVLHPMKISHLLNLTILTKYTLTLFLSSALCSKHSIVYLLVQGKSHQVLFSLLAATGPEKMIITIPYWFHYKLAPTWKADGVYRGTDVGPPRPW